MLRAEQLALIQEVLTSFYDILLFIFDLGKSTTLSH
jgi:hypothetical protein